MGSVLGPVQTAASQDLGWSGVSHPNEIIVTGDPEALFKYDLIISAEEVFKQVTPSGVSASAKISLGTLGHFCTSLCPCV